MKCRLTSVMFAVIAVGSINGPDATAGDIYFDAFGGVTVAQESDVDSTIFVTASGGDQSYDPGFVVGAAAGYQFDFGLQVEGEIAHRRNGFDDFSGTPTGGVLSSTSFMANLWYEFDTGTAWHPFVGGGIGAALVGVEDFTLGPAGASIQDDSDVTLAYQLGAGVAYDLTENIALTAQYRFFAAEDVSASDVFQVVAGVPIGIRNEFDYVTHNILFGIRVRL